MKSFLIHTLAVLSRAILKKYKPEIIGVTGSVGKTSTKEAIYAVLKTHRRVRRNVKNYNNEIGVPLTIIGAMSGNRNFLVWIGVFVKALRLLFMKDASYPEILILEMGADRPGDIAVLTKLAPCNVGILTGIGKHGAVHIEFFKDHQQLVREKGVMLTHLHKHALAIVNADDPDLGFVLSKVKAQKCGVGCGPTAEIRATDIALSSGMRKKFEHEPATGVSYKLHVEGKSIPVFLPNVVGLPPVMASLFAVAVGLHYRLSLLQILEALKKFQSPPGRMRLIPGIKKTLILDDTYNSSPQAVLAACDVIAAMSVSGRKIIALADMAELGSSTVSSHEHIGKVVAGIGPDLFVAVGSAMGHAEAAARKAGLSKERVLHVDDAATAGRLLQHRLEEGDVVLVKGSQSQRMERVVKELMAQPDRAKDLLVRQDASWAKRK